MRTLLGGITLTLLTLFTYTPAHVSFAEETFTIIPSPYKPSLFRFNNDNWFTTLHPRIASFTMNDDGDAYGYTDTGVSFVQYNVPNTTSIRVQRFEIQDHYHYIVDGEPVYTLSELSIRLVNA